MWLVLADTQSLNLGIWWEKKSQTGASLNFHTQTADKTDFQTHESQQCCVFPIMSTLCANLTKTHRDRKMTRHALKGQDGKQRTQGRRGCSAEPHHYERGLWTTHTETPHTTEQETSNPYAAPSSKSPHDLNSNDEKTQLRATNVPINPPPIEWMSRRELQQGVVQSLMPPFLIIHNTFPPGKCQRVIA